MHCIYKRRWSLGLLLLCGLGIGVTPSSAQKYYAATNRWMTQVGYYPKASPALAPDGTIYLPSCPGKLYAVNPDGSIRWNFKFTAEAVSTPAVDPRGTIYFGARDRRLYAVDAAGKQRWSFKTGGWVDASPALAADGTIYFGSWDKKFYALDPEGKKKWAFVTGGPIVSSAAIGTTGTIYFGSHNRKFYALNPDGSKRWEFVTRGAITSSPAIGSEGEIYFASTDGKLYAVNSDGSQRWNLQTGGITGSSPVIGTGGTIFVSVNQTHCAVAPDGKLQWQRPFWHPQPGQFGENAAVVLANDTVVFTGGDGYVMTVPADNGEKEFEWNFWLYGPSYSSPLVAPDGTVYVIGLAGRLEALERNIPLAQTPWPMFRADAQRTGRAPAAR